METEAAGIGSGAVADTGEFGGGSADEGFAGGFAVGFIDDHRFIKASLGVAGFGRHV